MSKQKLPSSEELIAKSEYMLEQEGLNATTIQDPLLKLEAYIIPGLENSKNILGSLYLWEPSQKNGLIGKLKNSILVRIRNIVLNVLERQVMRQQKFNDLMFESVKAISEQLRLTSEKKDT